METAEKKAIVKEIGSLEDRHCVGCLQIKKWKKTHGHYQAPKMCGTECEVGKRIRKLGDYISYGRPTTVARDLTEDVYQDHKEEGLTDTEIIKLHGCGTKTLKVRKKHWGLTKDNLKWSKLSVDEYMQMRDDGISDELICYKLKWSPNTLKKFKERHGITTEPVHWVKYTQEGKEITFELYQQQRGNFKTDKALCKHWGITTSKMDRLKKRWREDGLL